MTKANEIRTKDYVVSVYYDEHAESPREWDNLSTIVCWHPEHKIGDRQIEHDSFKPRKEGTIVLPLYLYDHSGITINTTGFHCPWDSGQVGWVYVTKEKIEQEYGAYNDETIEQAKKVMIAEVKTYDQYIRGEVYGFVIQKKNYNPETNEVELQHEESCWGFYGDIKQSGLLETIKNFLPEIAEQFA